MGNFIKINLYKYQNIILFLIYALLNFGILDNLPFSDDNGHVFNHSYLRDVTNPLTFLNPFGQYFKSWGLSYFYFWSLFQVLGTNFTYYRVLNLCLHFTNYILFKKLLDKRSDNKFLTNILSIAFLFHPLSILTTSWIFQAKTLLATMFALVIFNILQKNKEINGKKVFLLIICFFASLTSKISFIMLPFYFLLLTIKSDKKKNFVILTIVTMVISISYGLLNIKGITYIVKEVDEIKADIGKINTKHTIKRSDYIEHEENYKDEQKKQIDILAEIEESTPKYFSSTLKINNLKDRYIIAIQNVGRFALSSLGVWNYSPFYENNLETITNFSLFCFVFIGSVFLWLVIFTFNKDLYLTLLVLFPIAGIFYVPYMKYSYSSDHWFYSALFPFLLFLSGLKFKKKLFYQIFLLLISCQFTYNIYQYYDFNNLLNEKLPTNNNLAIIQEINSFKNDNGKVIDKNLIYDSYLSHYFFNSNELYHSLYISAIRSGNWEFIQKHFYRFAYDEIKNLDREKLDIFLKAHTNSNNIELMLAIPGLMATEAHSLSKSDYKNLINYLNRNIQ